MASSALSHYLLFSLCSFLAIGFAVSQSPVKADLRYIVNLDLEENYCKEEIEVPVTIDRAVPYPVQIRVDTDTSISTAKEGSDFTIENKNLTFPPNQTTAAFKIKIIGDNVAESTEILVLKLVSLNESLVTIGSNGEAKVRLNDKYDNDQQAQKQEDTDNSRRTILILLIVAVALVGVLFICAIVFCICCIKAGRGN